MGVEQRPDQGWGPGTTPSSGDQAPKQIGRLRPETRGMAYPNMSYNLGGGTALRKAGPRGRVRDLGLWWREVSGCSSHPLPRWTGVLQPPRLTLPGSSHTPPLP